MPTLHEIRQMIENSSKADWNRMLNGPTYLDRWGYWTSGSDTWGLDYDEHSMRAAFIPDVNLTVAFGLSYTMAHRGRPDDDREQPEWAKFPDPTVSVDYIDVFWSGALVDRDVGVTVDGGRAVLPDPTPEYKGRFEDQDEPLHVASWRVTTWEIALARVAHDMEHDREDFDEYFGRAQFTITDEPRTNI